MVRRESCFQRPCHGGILGMQHLTNHCHAILSLLFSLASITLSFCLPGNRPRKLCLSMIQISRLAWQTYLIDIGVILDWMKRPITPSSTACQCTCFGAMMARIDREHIVSVDLTYVLRAENYSHQDHIRLHYRTSGLTCCHCYDLGEPTLQICQLPTLPTKNLHLIASITNGNLSITILLSFHTAQQSDYCRFRLIYYSTRIQQRYFCSIKFHYHTPDLLLRHHRHPHQPTHQTHPIRSYHGSTPPTIAHSCYQLRISRELILVDPHQISPFPQNYVCWNRVLYIYVENQSNSFRKKFRGRFTYDILGDTVVELMVI